MNKLLKIQSQLKAPKNQRNNFGKYNYRSCEDILEAVKPLLDEHGLTLVITDQVKESHNLSYIESTAVIYDGDKIMYESKAQAGIDPNRKGMDIAQSFGSSSSYARKYALNGLLLIDDTKDADATNTHATKPKKSSKVQIDIDHVKWEECLKFVVANKNLGFNGVIKKLKSHYDLSDNAIKTIKTYV